MSIRGFDVVRETPRQDKDPLELLLEQEKRGLKGGEYDLVAADQPYPYTEQNHIELRDDIEPGEQEKGRLKLMALDTVAEEIRVFLSSIPEYRDERRDQAMRAKRSVEQVNLEYDLDWDVSIVYYEDVLRNTFTGPSQNKVFSTEEGYQNLKESESFSQFSKGMFDGWLQINEEDII